MDFTEIQQRHQTRIHVDFGAGEIAGSIEVGNHFLREFEIGCFQRFSILRVHELTAIQDLIDVAHLTKRILGVISSLLI